MDFNREGLERMMCSFEGDDIQIAFNARLLIEALATLDSNEVHFDLSNPNRAGILRPSENNENEELLVLVMPVMMNA